MVVLNDNDQNNREDLGRENKMKREIRVCVEQWSYKEERREVKKNN